MPQSIPSSTKILTLATAPFLFISVGVLFLSVNLLWWQACTFYCPLKNLLNNLRNSNETFRKDVTYYNIKSHKKAGLHTLPRRYIFGKTTGGNPPAFSGLTVFMVLVI